MHNFLKYKLQLHHRRSIKQVSLKFLQNSQEYTCAGVFLFPETLLKSDSINDIFLRILPIF